MPTVVVLTDVELRLASYLGVVRWQNNRKAGVVDRKIGPRDVTFTDVNGVAGELAVARLHNVYPDLTIGVRKGGYDLLVEGLRIDVKTTPWKTGRLLVTSKHNHDVDVYVLVRGDYTATEKKFTVVGYIPATLARRKEYLGDLGHGTGYVIPNKDLVGWEDVCKATRGL